jgi:hypothetical protein
MDSIENRMTDVEVRMSEGDMRMDGIERDLAVNTHATKEILAIVTMGKSFFKAMGAMASIAKWFITMGAACTAVYAAWTHRS